MKFEEGQLIQGANPKRFINVRKEGNKRFARILSDEETILAGCSAEAHMVPGMDVEIRREHSGMQIRIIDPVIPVGEIVASELQSSGLQQRPATAPMHVRAYPQGGWRNNARHGTRPNSR